MDSTKAIWDAIDNLGNGKGLKDLQDSLKTVSKLDRDIDRLLKAVEVYKQDAALKERALELACEYADDICAHYTEYYVSICKIYNMPCEDEKCDKDCTKHLKELCLQQAQDYFDAIENNKIVKNKKEATNG